MHESCSSVFLDAGQCVLPKTMQLSTPVYILTLTVKCVNVKPDKQMQGPQQAADVLTVSAHDLKPMV